jgi:thiamine-phosphate pyrophosphorylase
VGADGVHLGRDDASVREARICLPHGLIGVSCYDDPERARSAAREGADYVAIGSVFPSATKPGAVRAPLALIAAAREASGLPVAAIGGITADNVAAVAAAGADMAAVIAAVFDAADVAEAARRIVRQFESSAIPRPDARAQPHAV